MISVGEGKHSIILGLNLSLLVRLQPSLSVFWLTPSPLCEMRRLEGAGILVKSFHPKNRPLLERMPWAYFTVVTFSALLDRAMRENL